MQICKCPGKKQIKILAVICTIFFNCALFAADIEMPEMPSMPAMPSISLDNGFYTPTIPLDMMEPGKQNEKKTDSDESVIKNSDSDQELFQSLLRNDSTLTANDISTLYDSGLFTDLTSLTSTLGGVAGAVGNNYITNNSTNVILQEILNQLNELKQEQKKASPEEQAKLSNTQKDSANFKERNPSVLRFRINDYDIKDSLVEVFLSRPEDDGTFLLTGDRRYVANNKSRTETFYLLFEAEKESGAALSYHVIPSIVQDYENRNSFVYKLAQIKDLRADKTGNLVVLRYNDNKLNIDLLLDIDSN